VADEQHTDENKIGSFQLINCIAMGKFSAVWEVQDDSSSNRFAMKLLLPEALADPEQVQVMKYEAKLGKIFQDYPNFVGIDSVVANKKNAYFIMDLFKSVNLKAFIANDLVGVQIRIRKLIETLCLALDHMHHKGWVHKDVKPDNILVNKATELRLVDFSLSERAAGGLSKLLFKKKMGYVRGTPSYIAPETIRKYRPTPQTDIYSLGIVLFEILTGKTPFIANSTNDLLKRHIGTTPPPPSSFNPNIASDADRFVLRLLSKKPKDRPSGMQKLLSEFRGLRLFKEEIKEVKKTREDDEKDVLTVGARLDSRSDAKRTKLIKENPELAETLKGQAAVSKPQRPTPQQPAAQPQPQAPVQPLLQPMVPGVQQPFTGYPQGVVPVPQQPQPASASEQPTQQSSEMPAQPLAPQPTNSSPASTNPPSDNSDHKDDDDLPFMEELPDIR